MMGTVKFALVSLVVAASFQTQKPMNFAGTWLPAGKPGSEMVVTQSDKQVTIDYVSAGKSVRKDEIVLDGAEHRRAIPTRVGEVVMLYRAAWESGRLVVIADTAYPDGMKTNITETWSINPKGQLVIDSLETGPGGKKIPNQMILTRKQ